MHPDSVPQHQLRPSGLARFVGQAISAFLSLIVTLILLPSIAFASPQIHRGSRESTMVGRGTIYIRVENGATVRKEQKIGEVGNVGTYSQPHLHIHRKKGGTADDTKTPPLCQSSSPAG